MFLRVGIIYVSLHSMDNKKHSPKAGFIRKCNSNCIESLKLQRGEKFTSPGKAQHASEIIQALSSNCLSFPHITKIASEFKMITYSSYIKCTGSQRSLCPICWGIYRIISMPAHDGKNSGLVLELMHRLVMMRNIMIEIIIGIALLLMDHWKYNWPNET